MTAGSYELSSRSGDKGELTVLAPVMAPLIGGEGRLNWSPFWMRLKDTTRHSRAATMARQRWRVKRGGFERGLGFIVETMSVWEAWASWLVLG
uniref:Uncharacterized protein n=1 Tax=Oryza glumipatula TaxID=40148 RepID=A0A0D9YLS6_9ORYZ